MKNSPNTTKLQRTNILYKYECNVGDCEPQVPIYTGYTRTTFPAELQCISNLERRSNTARISTAAH